MGHWNYRIIRKENVGQMLDPDERYSFGIHEVYYNDDGSISSCTVDSMDAYGTTVDELKECFDMMKRAFDAPVLDYDVNIPGPGLEPEPDVDLEDIIDICDAQDGC